MAKKSKSNNARKAARERKERRFLPKPASSAPIVYLVGAVGAAAMGAGAWEQLAPFLQEGEAPEPFRYAAYVLAFGAVLVGIAIWIGTSGDPPLRVGDGGLALEKGPLRRMPWYAVEGIEWRDGAVRVSGKDDAGAALAIVARVESQPQAAAWIVKEARERVPSVVHLDDAQVPEASPNAGESLPLDPPQVVGKHCATSGKVIAYEPDARVCPRCDRVYHKGSVPETCACGASLESLRSPASAKAG